MALSHLHFKLKRYLDYRLSAKSKYSIHSPFLYDLIIHGLEDQKNYPEYHEIALLKKQLQHNNSKINKCDTGTGKNEVKSVKQVLRKAALPARYGKLLFRISRYFQSREILELGTSLGVSTFYLGLGQVSDQGSKLISIEGCAETHRIAKDNLDWLKGKTNRLSQVQLIYGNIDSTLSSVLKQFNSPDLVFFDANHTREATLEYFGRCKEKAGSRTIFIFDDIYWSEGMEEAWKRIKNDPGVTMTIDLYRLGLVFFDPGLSKQDFRIRF